MVDASTLAPPREGHMGMAALFCALGALDFEAFASDLEAVALVR